MMMMKESAVLVMCLLVGMTAANPLMKRVPNCPAGYREYPACKGWASNCQPSSMFYNWMLKNCRVTCNECKAAPTPYLTPQKIPVNQAKCLDAHDAKRALHGVPGLQWDDSLASGAADWALYLAKKPRVVLEHSKGSYGENIYYKAEYPPGKVSNCEAAVNSWYDEIKDYNFNRPGFSLKTGHFTQVVWKSTTKVGVGMAAVTRNDFTHTFVVARYSPSGNMDMPGYFRRNVPRLI